MRVLFLVLMTTMFLQTNHAQAVGGQESHGGDSLASEFSAISLELIHRLEQLPPQLRLENNLPMLLRFYLSSTVISGHDSLFLHGREVVAINKPQASPPEIHISRRLWKFTDGVNNMEYENLVLHELLPGLSWMDGDYSYSSAQMKNLRTWESLDFYGRMRQFALKNIVGAEAFLWFLRQKEIAPSGALKGMHLVVDQMVRMPDGRHRDVLDSVAENLSWARESEKVQNLHVRCAFYALLDAEMTSSKIYENLQSLNLVRVQPAVCAALLARN